MGAGIHCWVAAGPAGVAHPAALASAPGTAGPAQRPARYTRSRVRTVPVPIVTAAVAAAMIVTAIPRDGETGLPETTPPGGRGHLPAALALTSDDGSPSTQTQPECDPPHNRYAPVSITPELL